MITDDVEARPYRLGVGAVLLNDRGQVWMGRRLARVSPALSHPWQLPQGGLDKGEDPRQAVLRELEEETGTAKAEIIAETSRWLTYDLPEDLRNVAWKGRYRGQKQKWFALRFTGTDGDIDINADAKPEFDAWRWGEMTELPDLIVPFKRPLYRELLTEFQHLVRTDEAVESP